MRKENHVHLFVCLFQSYNDYMRDYHHNVGPPAPWQSLVCSFATTVLSQTDHDQKCSEQEFTGVFKKYVDVYPIFWTIICVLLEDTPTTFTIILL